MNETDRMKTLLEENPHLNKIAFKTAHERIQELRKKGILKMPEYRIDSISAIPPMVRVDHKAVR